MDIDFDLNLLATLKVLLEERHVTRAARRLCVTQPAVSKKLAQLRELFHDPLLVRVGNNLEPTALALTLEARLDDLFEHTQALLGTRGFDPMTSVLQVNMAVTDFCTQTVMPKILTTLLHKSPQLSVQVHLWQRIHLMDLLLGKVHCAKCHVIPSELPPEVRWLPLTPSGGLCLMRRDHPLAGQELTLENYLRYRHITYVYEPDCPNLLDDTLARMGLRRDIAIRYPSVRGAVLMLQDSDLLLSASREVTDVYVENFDLVGKPLPMELPPVQEFFLWHARSDEDPGQVWFRQNFLDHYQSLQAPFVT